MNPFANDFFGGILKFYGYFLPVIVLLKVSFNIIAKAMK